MIKTMERDHFPYQLVTFFDRLPEVGDEVYQGAKGWLPQLALKRRFATRDLSEAELIERLEQIAKSTRPFEIQFGQAFLPPHMPVDVVEVARTPDLVAFHTSVFEHFGDQIASRYIDRERDNYYPHMTISWKGKAVLDASQYAGTTRLVKDFWLIRDTTVDMDSNTNDASAVAKFSFS